MRIIKSKEIYLILNKNDKFNNDWINIFFMSNIYDYPRIGFFFTKKKINFAHDRNRIKRLIKESFRINQKNLKKIDFLINPTRKILILNNNLIYKKLQKIWENQFYL